MRWFNLAFPTDTTAEAVLQFTRSLSMRRRYGLLGTADPVVAELVVTKTAATWRLGFADREEAQVVGPLRAALPAVRLTPLDDRPLDVDAAWELRTNTGRRPLSADDPEQLVAALLASLQDLRAGEQVILSWLVGPWLHRSVVRVTPKRADQTVFDVGRLLVDHEQARALRDKQREPVYGVVGRIGVKAKGVGRQQRLRQRVVGALQLTRSSGVGIQRRWLPTWWSLRGLRHLQRPFIGWPCILNAEELAAVLAWPIGNPDLPNIIYGGGRVLPPVRGSLARTGVRLTGRATYPGRETLVGLTAEAALMHTVITGPTGSGKSHLICSLALQDAAAGSSVIVLDPSAKTDLCRLVAERLPEDRLAETVILDPTSSRPVGFNSLAGDPAQAVDAVLHILQEIFASSWGQRTADVLFHGLTTLARTPGMTLVDLVPLLTNTGFRRKLVAAAGQDDVLGLAGFWHGYEGYSEAERATVIGPSLNKLRSFTSRAAVRGIIGQSAGYDLSEPFFKPRIVLVSLAPGSIGSEAAQLLGSLLLSTLWTAAQRRSRLAPERRRPVLVYLDEFQTVLRLQDLGDALVQARGLGVGFVLAHQHRAQLSPTIRSAVDGNARSKIAFQSGHEDGTALAKLLGGNLKPEDFQALERYETYQALVVEGRTTAPMSVVTLPLAQPLRPYDEVREISAQRYGLERSAVDAQLLERRQGGSTEGPIGAKRRGGSS